MLVAKLLLRPQDRLTAIEKHPEEFAALKDVLALYGNAVAEQGDGYARSLKLLPPPARRGLVVMEEELKENYRPKFEEFIELCSIWEDSELANLSLNALERRAPKQYEAMMHILGTGKRELTVESIVKGFEVDRMVLKQLEKKSLIMIVKRRRDHLQVIRGGAQEYHLTESQSRALGIIRAAFQEKQPALLLRCHRVRRNHLTAYMSHHPSNYSCHQRCDNC